jgi:hypothetical protein
MPKTKTEEAPSTTVHCTTVQVTRTVKIGADEHAESEPSKVIEVHKFPEGVHPGEAGAVLHIRKSMQTANGDWVAGEVGITCKRACYNEELDDGTASKAAYAIVKDEMGVHLPKMLKALDQLAKQ